MTFPFSELCTLLSRLEDIELHEPPILSASDRNAQSKAVTTSWFKSHASAIFALGQEDTVALLSALLPERRTDRVYGVQSASLSRILSRCLGLSEARVKDLQSYRRPGAGDLATCLERVMSSGGPPAHPPVTLSEVDDMLALLAGSCRFSDPNVRLPPGSSERRDSVMGGIVKRLSPTQAKWLVRLVLKDFSPVRPNDSLVLQSFHFLLPDLLKFQNTFGAAVQLLKTQLKDFPPHPDPRSQRLHRQSAAALLKPLVGVKVGRPAFVKGRSIDSCIRLCGGKKWVLERKYDGEYCEIHIDMHRSPKPSECITIFSKSGKDSTDDRKDLHQTLVECLRLGQSNCAIGSEAIILGELVVFSDHEKRIMPFEHVRKHVSRSGVFLGTDEDSYPHSDEHLAIVFFDILLLDQQMIMTKSLEQRRQCLRTIYTKIGGRAMGAEWKIVDFQCAQKAKRTLIQQFAASISERCEGLVLKPCGTPYFSLGRNQEDGLNGYIKLKKDYIDGLGDEADFAVIGGSYNGQQALKSLVPNLRWTTFHLGCLLNKTDVMRFDARPRFKVVGTIQAEHCIPQAVLETINILGKYSAVPYIRNEMPAAFDVERASDAMDTIFASPFVLEVLGSGFEKPSNSGFFMLRHARVKKLHQDRDWKDCISYQELQEQADAARRTPPRGESQETIRLIEKLQAKCKRKSERSQTSTPKSKSKATPPTLCHAHSNSSVAKRRYKDVPQKVTKSPASRASADLDGTTLIDASTESRKRAHYQGNAPTPCPACPAPKKQRVGDRLHNCDKNKQEVHTNERSSGPLADITNTAPSSSPFHPPLSCITYPDDSPVEIGRLTRTLKMSQPLETSSSPPRCLTRGDCEPSSCLLNQAVIYASPCIANTPYIMDNLLSSHEVILIASLAHWDRDSLAHPVLTHIVAESQAYKDMRKIVLVEARRRKALRDTVRQILNLNNGVWRERVEVWDWRVLESEQCGEHLGLFPGTEHFLGATAFDEVGRRAVWVGAGDQAFDFF